MNEGVYGACVCRRGRRRAFAIGQDYRISSTNVTLSPPPGPITERSIRGESLSTGTLSFRIMPIP